MPKSSERRIGAISPTTAPHTGPHTKPHSSTGKCIGDSMLPISGICIVKKGSTMHSARNMAENTSLRRLVFIPFVLLSGIKKSPTHA